MTKKTSLYSNIFFSSLLIISLIYNAIYKLFLYNISQEYHYFTYDLIYLVISLNVFYYSLGFLLILVANYYNIVHISKNIKKYCLIISLIILITLIILLTLRFLWYLNSVSFLNPIVFLFSGALLSIGIHKTNSKND